MAQSPITYFFHSLAHTSRSSCRHDATPRRRWMAQAARNMSMVFAEELSEFQPTPSPEASNNFQLTDIVCHESLGGLLKHYERRAV